VFRAAQIVMEQEYKKKHIPPEQRRKENVSAETGHRKDVKKGGAGGKGAWGKEGDEYNYGTTAATDKSDPNYNSEDEGGATLEVTESKP